MSTESQTAMQQLLDKEAIREVAVKFCRGVDRGDVELLASVFHPDAIDVHGKEFSGPNLASDLIDLSSSLASRVRPPMFQHQVTNLLIEFRGPDEAVCESYFNAYLVVDNDEKQYVGRAIGRYLDRFERRDGEWRIVHRVTVGDLGYLQPLGDLTLGEGAEARPTDHLTGRRDKTDPSYKWLSGKLP